MSKKNWLKFGSSYDPSHSGKMQRPLDTRAEEAKREAERREHQLRGCLDPGCPMCNPETAAAGLSGRPGSRPNAASLPISGVTPTPPNPGASPRVTQPGRNSFMGMNVTDLARQMGITEQDFRNMMEGGMGMPFRQGRGAVQISLNATPNDGPRHTAESRTLEFTGRDGDVPIGGETYMSNSEEANKFAIMHKLLGISFRVDGDGDTWIKWTGRDLAPGTGPKSKAYKDAREEVEKWLSKAPQQAFEDIVGNDAALEQLRDAVQAPVTHKELYEAYGMKMPKGALLSGPPGCGKTMFARAAASEMRRLYGDDVEFISISGSELQSPYVGVTEGYIKSIFVFAREYKAYHGHPLLVFMDEADVLLPDRTGRVRRVASWEESQVATFLAEMDGIHESGAFVLLASNRPEVIDQAVLRDGRCDFKIVVKRPDMDGIETILRKNFAGIMTKATEDELVFAAVECLFDPNKVIAHAQAIGIDFEKHEIREEHRKHFLLEHIVSGAMAASIRQRAIRFAFVRDKATGDLGGVTVKDVVDAVNVLFEENKALDHSFALNEFKEEFMAEIQAKHDK